MSWFDKFLESIEDYPKVKKLMEDNPDCKEWNTKGFYLFYVLETQNLTRREFEEFSYFISKMPNFEWIIRMRRQILQYEKKNIVDEDQMSLLDFQKDNA